MSDGEHARERVLRLGAVTHVPALEVGVMAGSLEDGGFEAALRDFAASALPGWAGDVRPDERDVALLQG